MRVAAEKQVASILRVKGRDQWERIGQRKVKRDRLTPRSPQHTKASTEHLNRSNHTPTQTQHTHTTHTCARARQGSYRHVALAVRRRALRSVAPGAVAGVKQHRQIVVLRAGPRPHAVLQQTRPDHHVCSQKIPRRVGCCQVGLPEKEEIRGRVRACACLIRREKPGGRGRQYQVEIDNSRPAASSQRCEDQATREGKQPTHQRR